MGNGQVEDEGRRHWKSVIKRIVDIWGRCNCMDVASDLIITLLTIRGYVATSRKELPNQDCQAFILFDGET